MKFVATFSAKMPAVNVVALLGLLAVGCNFARSSDLTCAYRYLEHTKGKLNIDDNEEKYNIESTGEVLPDNKSIVCPGRSNFCYSLWLQDPQNKSQISMLAQGCWESSGKFDCGFSECISTKKSPKALNNTRFCCCSGTFCNINVSDVYVPTTDDPEMMQPAIPYIEPVHFNPETIIIISVVCSLIVFGIIVAFGYRLWSGFHKPNPDSLHLTESSLLPQSTPSYDLATLKLQEVIGRGRYGSVWKASLNDRTVAAKVYQPQHKQYYMNEKDIYTLPHFDHASLPKFLGSEERINAEGRTEYLIVLSYAPLGCLQDYLRNHVIDWNTLCKMSQSVAKGLAHLHIDIRKGDKIKPCVAHRDLNSRNVLVKADLSCFICDMGFAMKISGSRYYSQTGEEQHAETTSLTDVGTLRYMAPEVLEGAVNLRDCESSLKQIDVYALGLVLWEIMTRCEDLYQGLEVPEYRMPFEAEIGTHPTFEHMQVLISKNKARPLFSEMWKDSNQAVKSLKETIEECWDQDAEARLTSLCVDERLQELPVLWERHRINMAVTGVSPTVNPTSTQLTTMRNSSLLTNLPNYDVPPHSVLLVDLQNPRNQSRVSYHQTGDSSTSEATVETTVTTSPSEPLVSIAVDTATKKNANSQQLAPRATPVPLQPHQGRNPCIERNMNMEPLEELSISGNTLLEKGSKFKNSVHLNNTNNTAGSSNSRDVDVDNIFDVLQLSDNGESNLLVSNDVLSQSTRTCNPIPYVQNAVHGSLSTRPKQPNVPGNGQHYDQKVKKGPFGGKFDRKKNLSASAERKSQNKIGKDWGLKSLFDRKRSSKHNPTTEERKSENQQPQQQQQNYLLQNGIHGLEKSNLHVRPEENKPVPTEVCLLRQNNNDLTQIITRPTNGLYKSLENGFIQNGSCRNAEVGVAHLAPTTLHNGQAPVIKHRSSAASMGSSSGLSNCHSESDLLCPKTDNKLKRPTTLPLKGHGFKGISNEEIQAPVSSFQIRKPRIETNGSQAEKAALLGQETSNEKRNKNAVENKEHANAREKIVRRVKTPFKRKSGVFSVYDDRFMCAASENIGKMMRDDESLLQVRGCVSLPIDIDTVCSTTPNGIKDFTKNRTNRATDVNSAVPNGEMRVGESDREKMALKNGLVVTHWKGANCQFKPTDSGNDNLYQVSCL